MATAHSSKCVAQSLPRTADVAYQGLVRAAALGGHSCVGWRKPSGNMLSSLCPVPLQGALVSSPQAVSSRGFDFPKDRDKLQHPQAGPRSFHLSKMWEPLIKNMK